MSQTTCIRDVDWLVGWDGRQHVYLRNSDLVFKGPDIIFVGDRYVERVDIELSGKDRMIIPGLVDIHAHPTTEPIRKGITDETLSPGFWHSSLYEHLPVFDPVDDHGRLACLKVALAELLLSGVTTLVDLSSPFEGWTETLLDSGIRSFVAPSFRDARWFTTNGHSLEYDWDYEAGQKAFRTAQKIVEGVENHPSGRLSAVVSPSQVDTCSEVLLRDSHALARDHGLSWTIHAAQSVTEFHEMQHRHGMTSIQWLDSIDVLDERSLIAHGIFLDHHPWLHWTSQQDLKLLSDRGATIAHCPTVFSRRGIALNTFGAYLDSGVRMSIGTDTYPHNMLDECRTAAMVARIIGQSVTDLDCADVFNAATVAGAHALNRNDIGRIAVGCKADFSTIDLTSPCMRPVREPLRSLITVAGSRPVKDVFIHGEQVVSSGTVLNIDFELELTRLQIAQQNMLNAVPERDWNSRSAEELAPLMLKTVESI